MLLDCACFFNLFKASIVQWTIKFNFMTVNIFLTKTTAAQNDVALSYRRVRGQYFLAVVFAALICTHRCCTRRYFSSSVDFSTCFHFSINFPCSFSIYIPAFVWGKL